MIIIRNYYVLDLNPVLQAILHDLDQNFGPCEVINLGPLKSFTALNRNYRSCIAVRCNCEEVARAMANWINARYIYNRNDLGLDCAYSIGPYDYYALEIRAELTTVKRIKQLRG